MMKATLSRATNEPNTMDSVRQGSTTSDSSTTEVLKLLELKGGQGDDNTGVGAMSVTKVETVRGGEDVVDNGSADVGGEEKGYCAIILA